MDYDLQLNQGKKSALIIGATGLIGTYCLNNLLSHENYNNVIAVTRRPIDISHPKLKHYIIDFANILDYKELFKADDVFICFGTTMKKSKSKEDFIKVDYAYPYKIAYAAKKNGANQCVIVSAYGASPNSPLFYPRIKGELEKSISNLDFWSTHIMRPSLLIGKRNEFRIGEALIGLIGRRVNNIGKGILGELAPMEASTVARAMIQTAQGIKPGVQIINPKRIKSLANFGLEKCTKDE